MLRSDNRARVEDVVRERAAHHTLEDVNTTCSFARAERILGREYHGRFLIELLQNAADAARLELVEERSSLAIVISEGPTLTVANKGTPMSPDVIINSIGHIGASTKSAGEAIGHKGIGFKSVLELSLTPEIYSGLQESEAELSVGFDPVKALARLRNAAPLWDDLLCDVPGADPADPLSSIPILRFPVWIDTLPDEIVELRRRGYDTAVRLPYDARFADRLGLDERQWLETVRVACDAVSDQILILIGGFDEIEIEDRLDASRSVSIRPTREREPSGGDGAEVIREDVRVHRNGVLSSRWRLYRRDLPGRHALDGEIAVGLRLTAGDRPALLPVHADEISAPFHLFFPTRIRSGLPFMLHAYFEVDAARTGFYRGSEVRNRTLLEELARLCVVSVRDLGDDGAFDHTSLVNLVAQVPEPEDYLARAFRDQVLDLLDDVAWIPAAGLQRNAARPREVFAGPYALTRKIRDVFPATYVRNRTGMELPHEDLNEGAIALIRERTARRGSFWHTIETLCLPGAIELWPEGSADRSFRALLDLVTALDAYDAHETQGLLSTLRGHPDSRLIPVVGRNNGRELLPVPDPESSSRGDRERLVMARVRSLEGAPIVPPTHLDVAFLPDGLLSDSGEHAGVPAMERARTLGVRPFTVDDVLDRLGRLPEVDETLDAELVTFVWRLLVRARTSALGTQSSAREAARAFAPESWFWCEPGNLRGDQTARLVQQRRMHLASVRLPSRDGRWRPAAELAFGDDWAAWLERRVDGEVTSANRERVDAYRDLEMICPGEYALLAPPEVILPLLASDAFDGLDARSSADMPGEHDDEIDRDGERHAFLLRLGVWEVPPVVAFQNVTLGDRAASAWLGPKTLTSRRRIERDGERDDTWSFGLSGWSGHRHRAESVHLAEDFRFQWELNDMIGKDPVAHVRSLSRGARLYASRTHATFFCSGCHDSGGSHRAWRWSVPEDGLRSSLAMDLQERAWVPCTQDGVQRTETFGPRDAWWSRRSPTGPGMQQSPWRIVPLCSPESGMSDSLRRLAGLPELDEASVHDVERLLTGLRVRFTDGEFSSGSRRQAFKGLHRLAYERLHELGETESRAVVERTGLLCERGERLDYELSVSVRHDDGLYSAYLRHFVGEIPLAVIGRDRGTVATTLGVPRLALTLTRQTRGEVRDVTEEVRGFVTDRAPELLAIMVHHSLGTQTLSADGPEFEVRAERLEHLKVLQVDDLVIDLSVDGLDVHRTIGEGDARDLFLEGERTASPVLYHDLFGKGWKDRLRRKISPYLARLLENPAYAHTFGQFLQGDESEREEFLLELGISPSETEDVDARISVVGESERALARTWYAAILDLSDTLEIDLNADTLTRMLTASDFELSDARRLVELGGGRSARCNTGSEGALCLLARNGIDLDALNARLIRAGDPGLTIEVARDALRQWTSRFGLMLRAVLEARHVHTEIAQALVRTLRPPTRYDCALDIELAPLLDPVEALLREQGAEITATALADHPREALAHAGRFTSVSALEEATHRLLDEGERARFLRRRALSWRESIRRLAVLVTVGAEYTYSRIREVDQNMDGRIPSDAATPVELQETVRELFAFDPDTVASLCANLLDTIDAPAPVPGYVPESLTIPESVRARVARALDTPRVERVNKIQKARRALQHRGIGPTRPPILQMPERSVSEPEIADSPNGTSATPPQDPIHVPKIKVDVGSDRKKRELGDEGELWALASVVDVLMALDPTDRASALHAIRDFVTTNFSGTAIRDAQDALDLALSDDLDDEELIEVLASALHLSNYSDAFGFDLLGWLPDDNGSSARVTCLEVKSSAERAFALSHGEWTMADALHARGLGSCYAVLVVRRGRSGDGPASMDLLSDPTALLTAGLITREADSYRVRYEVGD